MSCKRSAVAALGTAFFATYVAFHAKGVRIDATTNDDDFRALYRRTVFIIAIPPKDVDGTHSGNLPMHAHLPRYMPISVRPAERRVTFQLKTRPLKTDCDVFTCRHITSAAQTTNQATALMLKNSVLDGREDLAGVRQVSVLQVVGGGGGRTSGWL